MHPRQRSGRSASSHARALSLRPTHSRSVLKGTALALALTLALAGCSTSSADEGTRSGSQTGYVGGKQVTIVKPSQRKPAPTVSGTKLGTAQTISSASYSGKVLVINVWASWCSPCRGEAKDLEQASKKTAGKAQFLGINNRDDSPANGAAFVRAHGITYPSIYDPSGTQLVKFTGTLPPSAIPSTMVIDKLGRIAVRILGPIDENTLVQAIDDVAAGK